MNTALEQIVKEFVSKNYSEEECISSIKEMDFIDFNDEENIKNLYKKYLSQNNNSSISCLPSVDRYILGMSVIFYNGHTKLFFNYDEKYIGDYVAVSSLFKVYILSYIYFLPFFGFVFPLALATLTTLIMLESGSYHGNILVTVDSWKNKINKNKEEKSDYKISKKLEEKKYYIEAKNSWYIFTENKKKESYWDM